MGQETPRVEAMGGQIAAVAVTATFSQMAFAKHLGVRFPLLSDWGRQACSAYGVRYEEWKGHDGLAKRSIFVIDRASIIRYRWATEDALELPELERALQILESLTTTAE